MNTKIRVKQCKLIVDHGPIQNVREERQYPLNYAGTDS